MLSLYDAVVFIVAMVVGVAFLFVAWSASRSARLIAQRPTTAIGALKEGVAEIAGTIHAKSAPVLALNGQRAVAVRTRVEAWVSAGKSSSWNDVGESTEWVEAEVRDATGACGVVFDQPVIVGPQWTATMMEPELAAISPSIAQGTSNIQNYRGHRLRLTQTVVADGGPALLEGTATAEGLIGGEGYRDARERFALRGSPETALLISGLGHRATLWRAAWPSIIVGGAGALIVAIAVAWGGASRILAVRVPALTAADGEAAALAQRARSAPGGEREDQRSMHDLEQRLNAIVNAPQYPTGDADGGTSILPALDDDAATPGVIVHIRTVPPRN